MTTTALTIVDLTLIAGNLKPCGRVADKDKAIQRLAKFLADRIGTDRADAALPEILAQPTQAAAERRMFAAIEAADEAARTDPEPPRRRSKFDAIEKAAKAGRLPPPPDFARPTHERFRAKLAALEALAAEGDIDGLRAFRINPVSSSPKALDRYRNLCVIALEARKGAA
jgi:hypothetical protein